MATIIGTSFADTLQGGVDDDAIGGLEGDDLLSGGAGNDLIDGGSGNDTLRGGEGNLDVLIGGAGNDLIDGGAGSSDLVDFRGANAQLTIDLLAGTALGWGQDVLLGIESVFAGALNDTVSGADDSNSLFGFSGNDLLQGRGGNDYLVGGSGDDTLDGGGGGADQVDYSNAPGAISADLVAGTATGEGNDVLIGIESLVLSAFDDTVSGSAGADYLIGGAGNDSLRGLGGNDLLVGGAGDDTLDGGDGSADLVDYSSSSGAMTVDLVAGTATGEGNDVLIGIESFLLSAFDDTVSGSAGADFFLAGAGNDSLQGLGGNDFFVGGAGNDTLDGGDGDADQVDYSASPGAITADLVAGTATGDGSDVLIGIESLALSVFDDTASGSAGADYLRGGAGNDVLRGLGGNDELSGGAGDDTLEGGAGTADVLQYAGSASAVTVDLAAGTATGEGDDRVSGFEVVILSVFDDLLSGDANANFVRGNAGNDVLNGLGGDDQLRGDAGNDTIDGGDGRDTVYFSGNFVDYHFEFQPGVIIVIDDKPDANGDDGTDTLSGVETLRFADGSATASGLDSAVDIINMTGPGGGSLSGGIDDDIYIVDDPLDNPVEAPGEGTDTVRSSINWTLGANLENLVLTGSTAIRGVGNDASNNQLTGNDLPNVLRGLGGNDTLDGGLGADTLAGGLGNDLYIVGSGDVVFEAAGGGLDTVQSDVSWQLAPNVERLVLTGTDTITGKGNDLSNNMTGNDSANKLYGKGGADRLYGMGGNDALFGGYGKDQLFGGDGNDNLYGGYSNDQLTGGAGADAFIFSTRLSAIDNVDLIKDFASGEDRILLDDDVFRAFSATVSKTLLPGQFAAGAGAQQATDADTRIIHDTSTGALYYDADGAGGVDAIRFATLDPASNPVLTAADFVIFV